MTSDNNESKSERTKREEPVAAWFCLGFVLIVLGILIAVLKDHISWNTLVSLENAPYCVAFAGTLVGAIGTSGTFGTTPDSKWRDYFSLAGWLLLLVSSVVAPIIGAWK